MFVNFTLLRFTAINPNMFVFQFVEMIGGIPHDEPAIVFHVIHCKFCIFSLFDILYKCLACFLFLGKSTSLQG